MSVRVLKNFFYFSNKFGSKALIRIQNEDPGTSGFFYTHGAHQLDVGLGRNAVDNGSQRFCNFGSPVRTLHVDSNDVCRQELRRFNTFAQDILFVASMNYNSYFFHFFINKKIYLSLRGIRLYASSFPKRYIIPGNSSATALSQ